MLVNWGYGKKGKAAIRNNIYNIRNIYNVSYIHNIAYIKYNIP